MNGWKKTISITLGAVLASVIAVSQMSCMSPEDQVAFNTFNASLQQVVTTVEKDKQTVVALQAELGKYKASFDQVIADIKAKKVPAESGIVLLGQIIANFNATQAKIAEVQKTIDENMAAAKNVQASIANLKGRDIPWYMYALPVGTALAGIASVFVPGLSPLTTMLQSANQQLTVTREQAGSLSRTLDAVTLAVDGSARTPTPISYQVPGSQPRLFGTAADLKEALMHTEQANDEFAMKADYEKLRAEAKANAI